MAKVQTVKSILLYYIIDTKLPRAVVARIALHRRLHARLGPQLLLHRSALASLGVFSSP